MTTLNNPYGIFDPKHWTNRKTKKPSVYAQTIGNPYLRSVMETVLLKQLDTLESQGKAGGSYWKFVVNSLHSIGAGDYNERDHGNDIKKDSRKD